MYKAVALTVEVFSSCTSAILGAPALCGRHSAPLWIVRHTVLGTECTQGFRQISSCLLYLDTVLRSSSPTPSLFPSVKGRMRWTCICRMNLFPEKPWEEGRNLMVVVQHKGGKTNVSCRKQWPLLYFLLQDTTSVLKSRHRSPCSQLSVSSETWICHTGCSHLYSLPSESVAFLPLVLHLREWL